MASETSAVNVSCLPDDIVCADSSVDSLFLLLLDCSLTTSKFSTDVLRHFQTFQSDALSSGPPGSIQVSCICFGQQFAYLQDVPDLPPVFTHGPSDFVLLSSVLNGVFERIRKPLSCVHLVMCTGAVVASSYPDTAIYNSIRRTLSVPPFPCRLSVLGIGSGFRSDIVEECMHPILHTRDSTPYWQSTVLIPDTRTIGPGITVLRVVVGIHPDAVDGPSLSYLSAALSCLWRCGVSYRESARLCAKVCTVAVDHENVSGAIVCITLALVELRSTQQVLRSLYSAFSACVDAGMTNLIGTWVNECLVFRGQSNASCASYSGEQAPASSHVLDAFFACGVLVDCYIHAFQSWRGDMEDLNYKRRAFVRFLRTQLGLFTSEETDSARVATRYHSLSPLLVRKAATELVHGFVPTGPESVDNRYENINMETYGSALATVRAEGLGALQFVRNSYSLSSFLPIPVRSLCIFPRPNNTVLCPWLVKVQALPTVLKFISVNDFFGRPKTLFKGHNENVNSFIPLPCSAIGSPVLHILATAAATGDPELYHPEALAALVASVVCCAAAGDGVLRFVAGGFWADEVSRALDVYHTGYPRGTCARMQQYMAAVVDDQLYRNCLITSGTKLAVHYQCPVLGKFVLGMALGGGSLTFEQFRIRYKAMALEYMGRNKPRVVESSTLFKAVSLKDLAAPLMMRYSSGQAVSKWAHLEVAVDAFKTEVCTFVSENVLVEDVLERPSEFLVDGSCLEGLRVWARVLSNLYVYTRGTPDASSSGATLDAVSHDAEDVYQRMLLTDGELARLVGVARASVSSYHQSVMPGWMGSDEVGYGHPSVAAAFGIWKSKFELYCVTEFELVYISESVRIHSSVALHVPPENGLALMMLTGVDVDKLFQLTPSGLSATRCMCRECPFFLKDLDDGTLRSGAAVGV